MHSRHKDAPGQILAGQKYAATGCNSLPVQAASAGVESPTVLPETEDRSAERRPWHVSHPGSGLQDAPETFPGFFGFR